MNTSVSAKRILVYSDSYVFGKIPGGLRYDSSTRFTGVMQNYLGADYEIIEEGLRGRNLAGENGFFPHRNGLIQFDGIFGSHLPLDVVMIFLGTNDCNSSRDVTPEEIVANYTKYLRSIGWWCKHLDFPKPKIVLIAPPAIDEPTSHKWFKNIFNSAGPKIAALPTLIKEFAENNKVYYFDASKVVTFSPVDGIHLDIENNRLLGKSLAQFIKEVVRSSQKSSSFQETAIFISKKIMVCMGT
ncbi:MAG: GDSL-type esterase/lipase family protein [bacterium]